VASSDCCFSKFASSDEWIEILVCSSPISCWGDCGLAGEGEVVEAISLRADSNACVMCRTVECIKDFISWKNPRYNSQDTVNNGFGGLEIFNCQRDERNPLEFNPGQPTNQIYSR